MNLFCAHVSFDALLVQFLTLVALLTSNTVHIVYSSPLSRYPSLVSKISVLSLLRN